LKKEKGPMSKKRLKKGLLIVFEGVDGSGKSTQVELLARKLARKGLDVRTLREPTREKWGEKIRELSKSKNSVSPENELKLFVRDRKENVKKNIKPALDSGLVVILDRYFYSTLAYQGAKGIPLEKIRQLHRKFAPRPDIVFILDVPVSQSLRRIKDRPVIYPLYEDKDYLRKVREIFLHLNEPECVVLDGRQPAKEVSQQVWKIIKSRFPFLSQN
jgi:dTMP kinase